MAKGQRRQAILNAALDVFTAKTLTSATMEDIRAKSGASTGSIYHHFASKEHIIVALFEQGYGDLHRRMRAAFMGAPAAASGLHALVDSYLGWFHEHELLGRFMLQTASTDYVASAAPAVARDAAELERQLLEWLQPFIASGEIVALPLAMYVPLIIGPCREIMRRWQVGTVTLAEARPLLAQAVWRSLAAGQAHAP